MQFWLIFLAFTVPRKLRLFKEQKKSVTKSLTHPINENTASSVNAVCEKASLCLHFEILLPQKKPYNPI